MVLTLTITKTPPGLAPDAQSMEVGPMGCSIGRGADNDWILPDPDRFLSSKHCQIRPESNGFTITDTSTNGVFLNGASEPLGRGMSSPLNEGDTFDLGDYRFSAVMQGANTPASDPFDSPSPFDDSYDFLGGSSDAPPSGGLSGAADDASLFGDSLPSAAKGILPQEEGGVLDPLAALDGASPKPSSAGSGLGDSGLGGLSNVNNSMDPGFPDTGASLGGQLEGGDTLSDAAAWPDAAPDQSLLPDDWDDDLSILNARKPQRQPFALPDDDSLIVNKPKQPAPQSPPPQAPPAPQARPQTPRPAANAPKPTPRPAAAKPTPRPSPQPAAKAPPARRPPPTAPAPQASPSGANSSGSRHFVDTLGFEGQALSEEQIAEIETLTAHMMRETLEGLMQVLRSRSSIKNEFRMNVTTIQPVENNPLKFSANADEVLEIMFLRNKNRAYKDPLDAVTESFQTIADHQVAVIAGIRSAFRSMMGSFDPGMLEETFKQNGKGGLLPAMVSGKMWTAYQDHYQSVVNNMESSFQELFGDEFVQAYEDQLRKLSDARRRSS